MIKKILVFCLTISILFSLCTNHISAHSAVLIGDLNCNGSIDAMDLVFITQYLLGINRTQDKFERADLVLDNNINILDFIKLQKLFVGENRKSYGNYQNDGVRWTLLDGDDYGVAIIPLGYRIITSCRISTDENTQRIVYEVSAFACAEKNPNPEIEYPDITVGTTTVNNNIVEIHYSSNTIVSPDWLWDYKIGYPENLTAPTNSEFKCIINCIHKDAVVALNTIENKFTF